MFQITITTEANPAAEVIAQQLRADEREWKLNFPFNVAIDMNKVIITTEAKVMADAIVEQLRADEKEWKLNFRFNTAITSIPTGK